MAKKSKKNNVDPELYQWIINQGLAHILIKACAIAPRPLPGLRYPRSAKEHTLTDAMISALKEYVKTQKE